MGERRIKRVEREGEYESGRKGEREWGEKWSKRIVRVVREGLREWV